MKKWKLLGKRAAAFLLGAVMEMCIRDRNNFLNIDPEAEKISFTSSKNPSPNSVQIVLRTDEISDDDESTDISDQEADGSSEEGPLKRIDVYKRQA